MRWRKALFFGLFFGLLISISAKWAIFDVYSSQDCAGKWLTLTWKSMRFCASSGQAVAWHIIDLCIDTLAIALAIVIGWLKIEEKIAAARSLRASSSLGISND